MNPDHLNRLPLAARGALEIVATSAREHLEQADALAAPTTLEATCAEIRRSLDCSGLAAELGPDDKAALERLTDHRSDEHAIGAVLLDLGIELAAWRVSAVLSASRSVADAPTGEDFRHGDPVLIWAPPGERDPYHGRRAVFRNYTDPRIGHPERRACVRLRGPDNRHLLYLEPRLLQFAREDDPRADPGAPCWQPLREWRHGDFELRLYDPRRTNDRGRPVLGYELFDARYGPDPVFSGADFSPSPLHALDADATAAALLSFLSLRPGETDADFFAGDTPRQRAWRTERAAELAQLARHLEDRTNWRQLHLSGETHQAVLAVAEHGEPEDLCAVLDTDIFAAYAVVEELVAEAPHPLLSQLRWLLLRQRNAELRES